MERVVAGRCDAYDVPSLKALISRSLEALDFTFDKCRVLLKPNLLSGKPPDKAVATHPLFVRAVAELFLDRSCDIFVGDSPGYESTEKALRNSGMMEVIEALRLNVAPFSQKLTKIRKGISPYREFILGEDPDAYDLVVNLPKLKTHMMMGLTAGVKNTFGFIPSYEKARWHLRCGKNAKLFASVLIDIYHLVNPHITIVDGITGMDGDGPSNGRPRHIGLLAASRDGVALDFFLERALGMPFPLPVSQVAREKGVLIDAEVIDLGAPAVDPFRMPKTMDIGWNLPPVIRETARRIFVKKPKCAGSACKACNICVEVCPAGALSMTGGNTLRFDYKKCIRCYCCQEMCPQGAISV